MSLSDEVQHVLCKMTDCVFTGQIPELCEGCWVHQLSFRVATVEHEAAEWERRFNEALGASRSPKDIERIRLLEATVAKLTRAKGVPGSVCVRRESAEGGDAGRWKITRTFEDRPYGVWMTTPHGSYTVDLTPDDVVKVGE